MSSRKRTSYQTEETVDDNSRDEHPQRKKVKPTSQASKTNEPMTDSNGDPYWEISRQRRVTVSSFKGRTMINVREYYEKDGQDLPGKKGISMTLEQFNTLVALLPSLEEIVRQKGGIINRPEYGKESDEIDENMQEEPQTTKRKGSSKDNIEATSEEESEDDE